MKPTSRKLTRPYILAASFALSLSPAIAGTYYWDTDGTTAGFGTASGTWNTTANWSVDDTGSSTTANTTITTADDVYFGTDTVGLGAGTVAGPSGRGFRNMTFGSVSGAIVLSGGTLFLNTSTGSTITVNNTANTISTTFVNNGSFTKSGAGKLTLSSTHGSFTGATIVAQGTLALTAGNAQDAGLYNSSSITINNGGTIEVGGDNSLHGYRTTSVGKLTINTGGKMTTTSGVTAWIRGALELNGGELASNATSDSGYGTWTLGQDVTAINAVTSTMSAKEMNWSQATTRTFTVSDAAGILNVTGTFARPTGFSGGFTGSLTKAGLGKMVLSGANNYTGATVVDEGILELSGVNTGNSGLYASSGITINDGGQVLVSTTNSLHGFSSTAGKVTINAGGSMTTANGVTAHIRGALELNGGELAGGTPAATFGGWTLNVGDVTATGTATSTISASQVNWTGTRTFTVVEANGRLDVTGTFDRPGGTMTGGLTKAGAGTMVLGGVNTYTGATQINSGKLVIGSGGSLAAASVVTVGGATATGTPTLAGIGTIGGATTIAAASGGVVGTHAPGIEGVSGGVGTQAFSSNLTYGNGSIFEWDLNAHSTSTGFDKVTVAGNVSVGTGTEFKINLGSSVFTGGDFTDAGFWKTPYGTQTWAMSDIFSKAFSSGAFASVTTVQDVSSYGAFTINGTSLTWTAVPEPTSALAGLLLTVGLMRRRRETLG